MSNSSTAATTAATGSLGRPAPTSFNASRTLGRAEQHQFEVEDPKRAQEAASGAKIVYDLLVCPTYGAC
jgi:hypothetical protein